MEKANQPNVIFFFTDQQRWDTCGCYGQKLNITPNLDQMAKEGVLFENAFTCQPVCGPARACLQTGRYASEIGCHTNNVMLPIQDETVAKIMRRNGYEAGYIGKWHLASSGHGGGPDDFCRKPVPVERRGGYLDYWIASDVLEFTSHSYDGYMFDADGNKRVFPEGRYRADAQTDWALEYLETRDLNKPFFLFLSYIEPHHQNDHDCYEGPKGSKEKFKNYDVPGDLEGTKGNWRENYPDYLGCINSLDENLGRVRKKLKDLKIDDNTIIIFTSDHGSHFRTRNKEYKRACHDGCTHIPMVISVPGFKGGIRISEMVSLIDLPPTILKSAGTEVPAFMKGRPLNGLVDGSTRSSWPDDVYIQISEDHCGRAIRTHKWKYSARAPKVSGNAGFSDTYVDDFLYDLENDPHEKTNLVADPAYGKVREEMRKRLQKYMSAANEPKAVIKPQIQ
ncbi:MAG TPA: arylsulfatase [Lentisphaeria bacterium]|nr:MAG: arylsulfatase [Lentisphaerae bacterium GWF2_50_93]HCE45254.1 arylsulfatase [Lentisphaeria bacterium]